MKPLRILIAGTPSTTVQVAQALSVDHTIVGVICPFPKPVGRKQIVTPCALQQWAQSNGVFVQNVTKESFQVDTPQQKEFFSQLPQDIDLLVVADFGFLIPGWLLTVPKHGGLNLHPSFLPRWRGAAPVPFTLLFGDKETGITIIQMNEKFDVGAIVAQKPVELMPDDTTQSLLQRAFEVGSQLLVEVLPSYIQGSLLPKPQPTESPTPITYKKSISKENGYIPYAVLERIADVPLQKSSHGSAKTTEDLNTKVALLEQYGLPQTAENIERMIRALHPWPTAWTILPNGKRMILRKASLANDTDQKLILEVVQIEGKNETPFSQVKNILQ